jgi:hypothetical protein
MATPSINNGIFYRQTQFDARSHVGKNYLLDMSLDKATDLGPVEFWAMTRKSEMPLYKLSSFGGQNIIEIDGKVARYQVPVSTDDTVEVVSDLSSITTDKIGLDGQPFDILLSTDRFGYGDLLKFDKYSNIELVVNPVPIRTKGEAFIYNVKLMDNGQVKFLDKKFLAPGNRIAKYGSLMSTEFGQNFSSWRMSGVGQREYLQYVGTSSAHTSYWISNEANTLGLDPKEYKRIIEFVQIDGSGDPGIPELSKYMDTVGMTPQQLATMAKNGQARMKFAYAYDEISLRTIARDRENYLMWGSGGRIMLDGQDEIYMSAGLWQQLDSGYKHIYNLNTFSLDMFKSVISNYLHPKVDFRTPGEEPVMMVETGRGGLNLAHEMIRKEANSNSMIVNQTEIGALTGDAFDLTFGLFYRGITIPMVAKLKFVYNPALDPVVTNQLENPTLPSGFPLSSYSFIIHDITENGGADNIKLLRKKDSKLRMVIENGLDAHPMTQMVGAGGAIVHQASSRKSGFGAAFYHPYDAIWVKDPTRVLKLVLRNPFTGNTL